MEINCYIYNYHNNDNKNKIDIMLIPHVQQVQFPYDQSQQGRYQQLYNQHY